jgi:hypothetical protein
MKTLLGELQNAISEGGYENTIEVCSKKAMSITKEISDKNGVYIKRTTLKYRNPLNKPDDYEVSILQKLEKLHSDGKLPQDFYEKTKFGDKTFLVYVRPIIVQPLCLVCHGENIPDNVRKKIDEIYKEDKATGYKVGDFRGIVILKKEVSE